MIYEFELFSVGQERGTPGYALTVIFSISSTGLSPNETVFRRGIPLWILEFWWLRADFRISAINEKCF